MGQANYWHERDCNYVRNNGTTEKHFFYCDCPADKRGVAGEGIRVGKKDIKDPVHLSTEVIPHKMRQFFNQMNKDKPFCMSISFKSPHGPWSDFDERYKNSFEDRSMPIAKSVDLEDALSRPEFLRVSLNGNHMIEKVKSKDDKNGKLQTSMRDYYKLVKGIDNSIGQIVDELKKRDLYENTVIIFLSDNGQFMAEHGFHGKWLMYEESIRVPFFIFDPRQSQEKRGILSDDMVLNIDVAPTVLDIAGIDIPSSMQGKSLTNLVEKPNQDLREHIFIEHMYGHGKKEHHIERSWAVRSKEWKYIKYKDQTGPLSEELYNLSSDPLEMNDLSDHEEYMDKLEELRKHFNNYLISVK
jgi:arylsulfatase A-like enzyme